MTIVVSDMSQVQQRNELSQALVHLRNGLYTPRRTLEIKISGFVDEFVIVIGSTLVSEMGV
jgi:hypothetical protein